MLDTHVEVMISRWMEMERAEHEYRRWTAFFYPLIDKAETGRPLCEVGLNEIRRLIPPGAQARFAVERILRQSPSPLPAPDSSSRVMIEQLE